MTKRGLGALFVAALVSASLFSPSMASGPQQPPHGNPAAPQGLQPILDYIEAGWDALTRSISSCGALEDPKTKAQGILYLPKNYAESPSVKEFAAQCENGVRRLPAVVTHPDELDPNKVDPPGLLYLEHPYVVPGGRFNEMYGWDSYFIIRGLIEDDRVPLAKGMVENFFFEIEHYGAVLNANRTYYLSRSQPPFLTSMILAVHDAEKSLGQDDRAWLARAYDYAQRDYAMWTRPPHVAGNTGLSRYYDFGEGPAPEALNDDPDYYRTVAAYFEDHPDLAKQYLTTADHGAAEIPGVLRHFTSAAADPSAHAMQSHAEHKSVVLNADFYKGDRALRESGFDITFRFGPYGAATHHYAPVCLNSLLYKTEKDLDEIARTLGRDSDAEKWARRAAVRRDAMTKYMWDPARGLFFDYDFVAARRSSYLFAATFYPLWAGLATREQAASIERNLKLFERPGGLMTSTILTGVQWDEPYAWAPIQLLAVEGLRRYGFADDANRISLEFLSMVNDEFRRDGTIREKYDAVSRSLDVHVQAGYDTNVIGFGWTNGVFLTLLHALPAEWAARVSGSR